MPGEIAWQATIAPIASWIHLLDGEQGAALAAIVRDDMARCARELQALAKRELYVEKFFKGRDKRHIRSAASPVVHSLRRWL